MSPAFDEVDKSDSCTLYAGTLDDPSALPSSLYARSSPTAVENRVGAIALGLGRIDQSQKATAAAIQIADKSVWAQRSYRVWMRRQSLSRSNMFSILWRRPQGNFHRDHQRSSEL
jgi:hypothetical protein